MCCESELSVAVFDTDEETETQDSVRDSLCVYSDLVCVCVYYRKKLVPLNRKVETRERRREVGISTHTPTPYLTPLSG